jgi:hypothetical protein
VDVGLEGEECIGMVGEEEQILVLFLGIWDHEFLDIDHLINFYQILIYHILSDL